MTTRNPMNERYQNRDEKRTGKTRKSAASAKPVTKAASSVRMESKATEQPKGFFNRNRARVAANKANESANPRTAVPPTPEYKQWHRLWVGGIVAAIALTLLGLLVRNVLHLDNSIAIGLIIAGDVLLVGSILIDVLKLSKMRAKYVSELNASKSKRSKQKRAEAEAEKKSSAKKKDEEEKPAPKKKSWNPFSTKHI